MTMMRYALVCALLCWLVPACDDDSPGTGTLDGTTRRDGSGGGDGSRDGSGAIDFKTCAGVTEKADNSYQPVDVILAIDNSKSMGDEIAEVQANMNRFSKLVADKNLDMRIIMVSCLPGQCDHQNSNGICIDAPVGKAGGCAATPANDNNPPGYTHVNERVPSRKGLQWIVDHYDDYKSMLRADAVRHIVVISDDTEEWTATQFETALLAKDPKFKGYLFHAIYSFKSKEDACQVSNTEPCCSYAAPGGEGTVYRELVTKTNGVGADLCKQEFDPVFDALGAKVVATAKLSCRWTIPPVPQGETFDPNKVNVIFTDGSAKKTVIGKVGGAADCSKVAHGWYFDDPKAAKAVLVCPQTCSWIQGDSAARIDLEFGCQTELAPIL
jgi:hypothetical protein